MKRHSPATTRNRDPLLAVLGRHLPTTGTVLEIAAGTGEHACWFAPRLPALVWQPSDADPDCLASIAAWAAEVGAPNLRAPVRLDVRDRPWPVPPPAAIFCANMIHITPAEATAALLAGAGETLTRGGVLILYGPFKVGGAHTAPSNQAFDADLRARDPGWGVRDLETVDVLAHDAGLTQVEVVAMPANNLSVIWRKT